MKPKLLYLITQGRWGGAQKYVYELARDLQLDFDITIATGQDTGATEFKEKLKRACLRTIILRHLMRAVRPLKDLLAVFEVRKMIKEEHPAIIHLNSSKAGVVAGIALLTLPKSRRPKVVYTAHGWVFDEPLPWPTKALYLLLEKITAITKDAIIVLSTKDQATAVRRLGISPERVTRIPIGIAPVTLAGDRTVCRDILSATNPRIKSALKIRVKDPRYIGTIANFYRTKGLDVLIAAAKTVCATKSDTIFIIIGDGPERPKLERLIQKNGLGDHVILTGFIADAAKLLPAFDLFVLPSRKEGMPYTLLEAISAGMPVIATAVGAIPEIIHNEKNGLIVPTDDPTALGSAILHAIENSCLDTYQNKFSLSSMLTKTQMLYRKLLSAKSD